MNDKVVNLMNKMESEKRQALLDRQISESIQNGSLEWSGQTIRFEEQKLLEDRISIRLPPNFAVMPSEAASLKYPSSKRPGLIFSNKSGTANITFNYTQNMLADEDVPKFKNVMIETIEKLQPAVRWQENGIVKVQEKNAGYLAFISPALDTDIYNLMFFTETDGRALIISFNCPEAELEEWRPIVKGIMTTLEITEGQAKKIEKAPKDFSQCHIRKGPFGIYHDKEYYLFKAGDNEYRLISTNSADLEDGFQPKDGVFKKTVPKSEVTAAHLVKSTIVYRGYPFELKQELKDKIQLVLRNYDFNLVDKLQMKMDFPGEYLKWIAKSEIEDILETYSPVEDFPMPEQSNSGPERLRYTI